MWTVLAILVVVMAALGLLWRIAVAGQRTPSDHDPSRQHEVPGAGGREPPRPGS